MEKLLNGILQKILEKKKLKNDRAYYYQVIHNFPTEFICFEVKWWWIIRSDILWVDIDKVNQKILVFYTTDKDAEEAVKEVAAAYALKCEKTYRNHFPPPGAY